MIFKVPNFKPVETTPQLSVGNYKAKITKAEIKASKGDSEFLKLTFEIEGHKGAVPNTCVIFGEPTKDNSKYPIERQREDYNRKFTSFMDSFGIERGDFEVDHWIGKAGEITVVPNADGSGYNEISYVVLTAKQIANRVEKAKEAELAKKQQMNTPAPTPNYQAPAPMGFIEDYPC